MSDLTRWHRHGTLLRRCRCRAVHCASSACGSVAARTPHRINGTRSMQRQQSRAGTHAHAQRGATVRSSQHATTTWRAEVPVTLPGCAPEPTMPMMPWRRGWRPPGRLCTQKFSPPQLRRPRQTARLRLQTGGRPVRTPRRRSKTAGLASPCTTQRYGGHRPPATRGQAGAAGEGDCPHDHRAPRHS